MVYVTPWDLLFFFLILLKFILLLAVVHLLQLLYIIFPPMNIRYLSNNFGLLSLLWSNLMRVSCCTFAGIYSQKWNCWAIEESEMFFRR